MVTSGHILERLANGGRLWAWGELADPRSSAQRQRGGTSPILGEHTSFEANRAGGGDSDVLPQPDLSLVPTPTSVALARVFVSSPRPGSTQPQA